MQALNRLSSVNSAHQALMGVCKLQWALFTLDGLFYDDPLFETKGPVCLWAILAAQWALLSRLLFMGDFSSSMGDIK